MHSYNQFLYWTKKEKKKRKYVYMRSSVNPKIIRTELLKDM